MMQTDERFNNDKLLMGDRSSSQGACNTYIEDPEDSKHIEKGILKALP